MESNSKNSKRIIYSRENSREEKLNQKKERRKRRKMRERQQESAETTTLTRQEASFRAHRATNEQMKPSLPSAKYSALSRDAKQCHFSEAHLNKPDKLLEEGQVNSTETTVRPEAATAEETSASDGLRKPFTPSQKRSSLPKDAKQPHILKAMWQKPEKHLKMKTCSRGALLLQMARGGNVNSVFPPKRPPPHSETVNCNRNFGRIKKQRASEESKIDLKELNPEHLEYVSADLIGSGSYGQCFRARYRGIDVLLKKMTHNSTAEDKERARKNLIHEARVVCALGDHPRLPMIFGAVTEKEPLCLVTQFHGVNGHSVTFHQAANTNLLTPQDCIEIFLEICSALRHVHHWGYLHNDIKANNAVLERESASEDFKPVLIDSGKSTKAAAVSLSSDGGKKRTASCHCKSYLAPEVLKERSYSAASDVYSLGRMLKAVSSIVGFYPRVRTLVKEAMSETPSMRPRLDDFKQKLKVVKLL